MIDNAVHVMRMPRVSLYNLLLLVDGSPRIWRQDFVKNIARTKAAACMLSTHGAEVRLRLGAFEHVVLPSEVDGAMITPWDAIPLRKQPRPVLDQHGLDQHGPRYFIVADDQNGEADCYGLLGRDSILSSRRPPDLLTKRSSATDKSKRRQMDVAEVTLTGGQVNAVRSAFKAGITPSRIARQFGLTQSSVRKALASDEPK